MLNVRCLSWLSCIALLSTPVLSIPATARAQNADSKTIAAFRADLSAKAKAADKNHDSVVAGRDGWMFFAPELRHVGAGKFWGAEAKKVSRAVQPEYSDPLPAILDFKAQLDKAGVKLLLVPVPPKAVIYADKISSKAAASVAGVLPRHDSAHREFYQLLRARGVNVLDLTEPFLQKRGSVLYCKQDTHWSGRGIVGASQRIVASLKSSGSLPKSSRKYSVQTRNITLTGDLWDALPAGSKRLPKEVLPLRFVGTRNPKNQSTLVPVPTSRNSSVLLMGDSHTLIFHEGGDMHARGAGLADQLAYELGFPVDLLGVRGSGATPARVSLLRRARANPNYLKNKKWIVWCFSAREFTESAGWQKVPVVK